MYSGVPHAVIVADVSLKRLIPKSLRVGGRRRRALAYGTLAQVGAASSHPILTTAGSSKTKQLAGLTSRWIKGGSDECKNARPRASESAMRRASGVSSVSVPCLP